MKSLNSFLPALALVLIHTFGLSVGLSAQTLNGNGSTYTINANGSSQNSGSAQDYTIPSSTSYNSISFTLRGGDGGYAEAGTSGGNPCKSNGGAGATTVASFWIGNGANELLPGGTIRFIVGKHDENDAVGGSNNTTGGGGGGTAVLYRASASDDWTILAAAGGGGGAHQGNAFFSCIDSQLGQGGRSSESGGNGEGNNHGNGGSNGNGGTGGSAEFNHGAGGGGAYSSGGDSGNGSGSKGGGVGLPDGGTGGNGADGSLTKVDGGYGFGGGGGAGYYGGGGGGGYSGGGGGGTPDNGGGGGSYANPTYDISSTKTAGANGGGNSVNGNVKYTFQNTTITWTGAVDHDWHNSSNWTPAIVPTSSAIVHIDAAAANAPYIWPTATAKARVVLVFSGGELTIQPNAILNVHPLNSNGISNYGTITNDAGAIYISPAGGSNNDGILNQGGAFLNKFAGEINIQGMDRYGIWNTSNGSFTNQNGGTINIGTASSQIGNNGTQNDSGSSFTNSGLLDIRNTNTYGIYTSGSFTNQTLGVIKINQTVDDGIRCTGGLFANNGEIRLGESGNIGDVGVRTFSSSFFRNNANGVLSIWHSYYIGVFVQSNSTFENFGNISIGGLGGSGIQGVAALVDYGSFTNKQGGEIFINQTAVAGILNGHPDYPSVFNNEGNISIGAVAATGADGIQNQSTFNNTSTGSIDIVQAGENGIRNFSGTFTNNGLLKIGENGSIASAAIRNNGNGPIAPVFSNSSCSAVIHIFVKNIADDFNSFTNSGTILKESTGSSNIETNNGTILYNAGSFTADNGNAPVFVDGSLLIEKVWTGCASSDWATAENWAPPGAPTASSYVVINPAANNPVIAAATAAQGEFISIEAGASLTNHGSLTVTLGNLHVPSGATLAGNGAYFIPGSIIVNGTFIPGTSTVTMNGTNSRGIYSSNGSIDFYSLVLDKPSDETIAINTNVTVTNSLNLSSGILNIPSGSSLTTTFLLPFTPSVGTSVINNGTLTLTGSGFSIVTNVSVQGDGQYILSGATTGIALPGGTFNPGTSTVTLSGTGDQSVGSGGMNFYNLVIDKPSGIAQLGGNITVANELDMVSGNLNLRGRELELIGNGAIIGEGPSSYMYGAPLPFTQFGGVVKKTVDLNAPVSENPGNIGVSITSSANLGSTTIQRGHDVQQFNGKTSILRYYDISPTTNSGLDATVRFYYLDHELNGNLESDMNPHRFNGTDWEEYPLSTNEVSANWVEAHNVDAFSKWTLADCGAPIIYHADADGDGYGNPWIFSAFCDAPSGYVLDNTDCDDTDPNEFPGQTWYRDFDGDGYGDPAVSVVQCGTPSGYVLDNTDCNDTDPNVNPNPNCPTNIRTWTGHVSTDWADACNWTPGCVPTANNEVVIPDVANDPMIGGSTAAVAKSVTVEADALLSIASGGSLTLDVVSNNLGIENLGAIDNDGTITVDGPTGDGIYNEGNIDNAGTINIGHTQSPTQQGIQIVGTLANTGTLDVRRGNDQGIQIDAGGQLTNESPGNVFIGQNGGSLGVHGLKVYGTFTNDGGTVRIDNATENGIRSIGGAISNLNGGAIHIGTADGNIGRIGLFLESGAGFTNDGSTLNIDNTGSTFAFFGEGIGCYTASLFENKNGGAVNLGLSGGSIGNTGIYVFSNSTFNNDGADINIDNTGNDGIYTAANFNNKNGGNINIGWVDGNIVGDGLQVGFGGTFHNQVCSNTKVADNLNILSNFTNDGYLLLNTAENHAPGNFVNNGIVEDVQGTFTGGTNNEIIIAATTSNDCAVITPAFQLGTNVDFNILGIYTDESATQSAGAYNLATNTFTPANNLPETTATYYVKVEDAVGGCTHILSWELATVNCCPNSVTCYLDSDGDTYGAPAVSQLFCETCGTGYVLDNTDCDDGDGDEFPGQAWYKDEDFDGYTDGTTHTACERPWGHKLAGELTSTTLFDCDDSNEFAFPGNPEVCDGADNDCNGSVDEGLNGLTYVGNVIFSDQYQIDIWPGCYTSITGGLYINGNTITDLSPLTNLTSIGGHLIVFDCDALSDLDGLENISSVGGTVGIAGNGNLVNVDGLSGFSSIPSNLEIDNNFILSNLDGLGNITSIGGKLFIRSNPQLTDLDDFANLTSVGTDLEIQNNNGLSDCCGIHYLLETPGAVGNAIIIANNDMGCDSQAEVETNCGDADNDGYSVNDGDCDDNDENEFPGQTWYEDKDNDGYTTGTTQTACERPSGYRTAAELVNTTDLDCNDSDANANPNPDCSTTTRTWTGHVSTDWDEPCNWSPNCVPTADDDITIPNSTDGPVISASSAALAKSVSIFGGATLTINSGGSLTIDGASSYGLWSAGTVFNEGLISIDNAVIGGIFNP